MKYRFNQYHSMEDVIESIVEWHTLTFKDITEEEQQQKAFLELKEYAVSNSKEELADVFITQCVLAYRFGSQDAKEFLRLTHPEFSEIFSDIKKKYRKNLCRHFEKINGEYRHTSLKEKRRKAKITQEFMAEKLGKSRVWMSAIEREKATLMPDVEKKYLEIIKKYGKK